MKRPIPRQVQLIEIGLTRDPSPNSTGAQSYLCKAISVCARVDGLAEVRVLWPQQLQSWPGGWGNHPQPIKLGSWPRCCVLRRDSCFPTFRRIPRPPGLGDWLDRASSGHQPGVGPPVAQGALPLWWYRLTEGDSPGVDPTHETIGPGTVRFVP
jgi:hypothetical protein